MGGHRRDADFSAYVAARRAELFRAAYLLTGGDAAFAEDVVQQALTRLYAAWGRAARADSIDAYARRILVNAHLDERRRPWRRERAGLSHDAAETADRTPVDERLLDTAVVEDDAVTAALRTLPPGQRRVVVLRHYVGLSVEETAADLGVSTGTVKSQTSAALAHLRAALAPLPDGNPR